VSEQVKAGDKVWVLCEVVMVYKDQDFPYVDVEHDGTVFQAIKKQSRPVEPVIEACTKTANDQLLKSLMDYPFGEPANSPEIPDSSSDPIKVGDAVRFVLAGHKWNGTEGTIISTDGNANIFIDPSVYPYRFRSDCGAYERWCPIAELERIDKADPINPAHYKQGGIECIEAMKVALGGGFLGYLRGNAIKYLWRYDKKNGVEDLRKARWYLDRLIREVGE
jgi:hypothetical protein